MASLFRSWSRFGRLWSPSSRSMTGVRLWSSSNENKEVTVKKNEGGDMTEHVHPEDLVKKTTFSVLEW